MTKTMSFAAVHFTVAFAVGYLLSGSVLVGGAIALVEPFWQGAAVGLTARCPPCILTL
jgi:uncharacterized membrane protein